MADDIPYIVVNNVKIAPLNRSAKAEPASEEKSSDQGSPFGVVDRVTISDEAREKSRQYRAREETDANDPGKKKLTLSP